MQDQGSGGLGAVSIGISDVIALVGLVVIVFVVVKVAKLLWAAISN